MPGLQSLAAYLREGEQHQGQEIGLQVQVQQQQRQWFSQNFVSGLLGTGLL